MTDYRYISTNVTTIVCAKVKFYSHTCSRSYKQEQCRPQKNASISSGTADGTAALWRTQQIYLEGFSNLVSSYFLNIFSCDNFLVFTKIFRKGLREIHFHGSASCNITDEALAQAQGVRYHQDFWGPKTPWSLLLWWCTLLFLLPRVKQTG